MRQRRLFSTRETKSHMRALIRYRLHGYEHRQAARVAKRKSRKKAEPPAEQLGFPREPHRFSLVDWLLMRRG